MEYISGGVCAAAGFRAWGLHCGVKNNSGDKKDLALIVSDLPCAAGAVYTTNVVKAAPVLVTRAHLMDGRARAILANSGNANACAPHGEEYANRECELISKELGLAPEDIVVASTGVIGQTLNIAAIEAGIPALAASLSYDGSDAAARAIMTTDTLKKEAALEFTVGGVTAHIGGIAKGSGMIHPNMGTLLCFITTDVNIAPEMVDLAVREAVRRSFNRVSVDGDTSTNDMCVVLANGMAKNPLICDGGEDYTAFLDALCELTVTLAKRIASDGEGAKHLITCTVSGAADEAQAEVLSKAVISSSLTKAAVFGCDANWGRVLCAMGYSGVDFDPELVGVSFSSAAGSVQLCALGRGLDFDEELAKKVLSEHDVQIGITLGLGDESCTAWGCDLTYEYVRINGDYRT